MNLSRVKRKFLYSYFIYRVKEQGAYLVNVNFYSHIRKCIFDNRDPFDELIFFYVKNAPMTFYYRILKIKR